MTTKEYAFACDMCRRVGHDFEKCPKKSKAYCNLCKTCGDHLPWACVKFKGHSRCPFCKSKEHKIHECEGLRNIRCGACGKYGHRNHFCNVCSKCNKEHEGTCQMEPDTSKKCRTCNRDDHVSRECPDRICGFCKGNGHSWRNCPLGEHNFVRNIN